MKIEIIESLMAMISGCSLGLSAGIGFYPKWKQRKNILIQCVFAIIGSVFMGLLFFY